MKSELNLFLIKFLLFGLVVIVMYPFYVWGMAKVDMLVYGYPYKIKNAKGGYGHMWNRLLEADTTKNVDILILGSSLAYRGIDPRNFEKLNLKVFNLGSSAQTPLQTKFLLEKYYERLNPKIVLWEVSPFTFENSGLESFIDISSNYGFDFKFISQAKKIGKLDAINTLAFVAIENLLEDFKNFEQSVYWRNDHYISNGYVEKLFYPAPKRIGFSPINLEFKNYQIEAFLSTLEMMGNSQIILFSAPILPEKYNSITNRVKINEFFMEIVKKYELAGYHNFNDIRLSELNFENHYYDSSHLNQNGVQIFNAILINEILIKVLNQKKKSI